MAKVVFINEACENATRDMTIFHALGILFLYLVGLGAGNKCYMVSGIHFGSF